MKLQLYEINNGKATKYCLQSKEEQMKEYRIELIRQQYKRGILFYKMDTGSYRSGIDEITKGEDIICSNSVYYQNDYDISMITNLPRISSVQDGFSVEALVQWALACKYVRGELSSLPVVRVNPPYIKDSYYLKGRYNFIITTPIEKRIDSHGFPSYSINNIINLPNALANLSFIEQEKFESIYYNCLNEQLDLFDLVKVDSNLGVSEEILCKASHSKKLLNLVKKI